MPPGALLIRASVVDALRLEVLQLRSRRRARVRAHQAWADAKATKGPQVVTQRWVEYQQADRAVQMAQATLATLIERELGAALGLPP